MLLPRILSAIVMAVLFICAVFVLDELNFVLAIVAVVLVAGWEWARLAGVVSQLGRCLYGMVIGGTCLVLLNTGIASISLYIAPLLWLLALYWVTQYPSLLVWQHALVRLFFGAAVLVTTWAALAVLRQSDLFVVWVLLLMGLIWGADSGAYFAGKLFGKRKLAKHVSPGKSWEGVIGGIVLTQLGVALFASLTSVSVQWPILAVIALVTASVSVLGDLTESLFKRHEGVKDSSQLIPGHGGVMDRVDSLTAAAPLFVLMMNLVGWL
ncbi:phosphatidate cytidylyltransferase [Marinomonas epiphytica]